MKRDPTDRSESARRLRESEERFRAAVDAVEGVVWTNDAEGRMSGEQPEWSALTGQSLEEYQGYGWAAAVHPDDAQPTVDAWSTAVAERCRFVFEHRVLCREGDYRRFAIRALPLLDPDGSIREWVGVHTDVTERHARERRDAFQLALSDLLVRASTSEEASAGVVTLLGRELGAGRVAYAEVDEDAGTLTISREYSALGMPATVGTYPLDGLGPSVGHYRTGRPLVARDTRTDPRTSAHDGLSAYEAAGTLALLDMPLVRNGRLVAILAVNHPEPRIWTRDEIELVRATAERTWDAFERSRAEERIRELNATLEQRVTEAVNERNRLWEVSEDLFVTADFAGRLLEVSGSWTRILGWDSETLARKDYAELIHPEDLGIAQARMEELLQSRKSVTYENRVLTRQGDWRLISWSLNLEPGGDRLYGVGRDVTEARAQARALAEVQGQLHEAQKLESIGQLTGGVAHDSNNLLTPIVGALDIVSRRTSDDRSQHLLAGAIQSADRARTLIQRLLAFARRQTLQPRSVAMAELVMGMRELIERSLGPASQVGIDVPGDLPPVTIDPNQLELALLNLCLNARDAMPEGGHLRIEAAQKDHPALAPGHYLRLRVTDTGTGMDEATRKRAIEPFFSTKGVGRGTGLGLSMVHGLALQSNGRFELVSELGHGTSALLWLPLANSPVMAEEITETEIAQAARRATVLLVDDEDLVRATTAESMRELGYDVVEANGAERALEAVRDGLAPDLVVTDHMMPGMTGADFAMVLRGQRPDLPILLITGYANLDPDRIRGLPVLAKPFRQAELATALSTLLPEG